MMSYVYRNRNSYESIINEFDKLKNYDFLEDDNGTLFFNDDILIDVGKRYTSVQMEDRYYDMRSIKKIVQG